MVSFEILWKRSTEHDLRKLPQKQVNRILKAVEPLNKNPFPTGCRKLRDSESFYRIRVGDYRVVYNIDKKRKMITIYYIRHRKDAYRS
ncbi:MAG: type II toxin-antitoxin system RelE/ParE family toxin [Candidatus Marinimicrobia bacterium]|nr:type II toxin-antitoxin system RelE/ParE family toxin [Candidatus Neomarinimicrobiota bacterium]